MKKIFILLALLTGCWFIASSQVGIGTSSPSVTAILELKSSNKGLLFPRTNTATRLSMQATKGLMIYDTSIHQFFYHDGFNWKNVMTGPYYWQISQFDGVSIYNTNTGNVGINTQDYPPYKFSVFGTIYTQDTPKSTIRIGGFQTSTEARILWELPSNNMDYNITQNANKFYISRTIGSGFENDIVLEGNGRVGIGTETPQVKLNVEGGTDVGNTSGGYLQLGMQSGLNIGFDNNEIQARDGINTSRLVLNNGGGPVQIGSVVAPTGYILAINGRTICEELKIQDSGAWPDYVFAKEYKLKSIDELRSFIRTHHHLPNIPSAAEVEKEGILIGDMQKKMMEKIEELTLYILQLEEKYSQLAAQLDLVQGKQN